MKLKTLKDFDIWHHHKKKGKCEWVTSKSAAGLKKELRKEAIKWYHRSEGSKHKFIREFFNITEEDLK